MQELDARKKELQEYVEKYILRIPADSQKIISECKEIDLTMHCFFLLIETI
ncbi:hypothetical protein MXB_2918 [Myxobolus squamalis]|nr:hypothetical protein MXB_2918 [Myxobolus squamalis]